jgi:integrase
MHRDILTLGGRGHRVRVYIEGDLVRVRWRINGARKHQSWANTPENRARAKAFAHGLMEQKPKAAPRLTLRQIWEKYQEAEYPSLRPKSQERYLERWRKWERFLGREFVAEDTTQENADQYRSARAELGIAINQIAEEVKMAKLVYAWAQRRRLIALNDLALYRFKIAKEDRAESPAEYRLEDFDKIIQQFRPEVWGQWRPWALLTLLATQGVRTNSARHLQWDDVDLDAMRLTWRARYDKLGREWTQPLRAETHDALMVAQWWREKMKYTGPWVFFSTDERRAKSGHEAVYGHQALAYALAKAERAAGVPHLELRAMHGLRRMVVGEIVRLTGDIAAAAQFIGDTDLRVVNKSYLKRRDDQLRDVANRLDLTRKVHQTATGFAKGEVVGLNGEPLVGFEPTTAPLIDPYLSPDFPARPSVADLTSDPTEAPDAPKNHPESATELQSGSSW